MATSRTLSSEYDTQPFIFTGHVIIRKGKTGIGQQAESWQTVHVFCSEKDYSSEAAANHIAGSMLLGATVNAVLNRTTESVTDF
jgi:hypothetical protein